MYKLLLLDYEIIIRFRSDKSELRRELEFDYLYVANTTRRNIFSTQVECRARVNAEVKCGRVYTSAYVENEDLPTGNVHHHL